MSDLVFERCSCGRNMTGVFPSGLDVSSVPGSRDLIMSVCSCCDYAAGVGGPPIAGCNLSLVRNTRRQ